MKLCSVSDCARRHYAKSYCQAHYMRVWHKGSARPNDRIWARGGTNISYRSAHRRVQRHHGPAAEHQCRDCGSAAANWAYTHTDPDVMQDARGRSYSADPAHYIPLCLLCHRAFDKTHAALQEV